MESTHNYLQIQILSDTHLEFFEKEVKSISELPAPLKDIPRNAPVLALIGDIGNPFSQLYDDFVSEMSKKFDLVLIVAGNHEYYFGEISDVDKKIEEICSQFGNVHYLQRKKIEYNDVVILGATLWTNIPLTPQEVYEEYWRKINDYRRIKIIDKETNKQRLLEPKDTIDLHAIDKSLISNEISQISGKKDICVLTHHAPTNRHSQTEEMREGGINFSLKFLDYSDLTNLMGGRVRVWAFGHTHHSSSQIISGTKVVSNCLGYLKLGEKREEFSPSFVVDTSSQIDDSFSTRGHYSVESNTDINNNNRCTTN